jgi:hypothetical protein
MRLNRIALIGALAALAAPAHAATPEAGTSAVDKSAPEIAPPPAGMGQVVFYRSSAMGALISCRVHEGAAVVNKLPPGKYFVHQTTPGVHEYSVKSEAKDTLRVAVEEGETQYARCAIGMGFFAGRPNLSTQNRDDFEKRGKGLKLQPPFDANDKNEKESAAAEAPAKG